MAELGWLGFNIPEDFDGMGYSFENLTMHIEEVGKNILPGPYISTVVNTFAIVEAGSDEMKKDLLPKISKVIASLHWPGLKKAACSTHPASLSKPYIRAMITS